MDPAVDGARGWSRGPQCPPLLELATKLGRPARLPGGSVVGWVLTVYPTAGEAGGSFCYADRRPGPGGGAPDPERAAVEAARRARTKVRRYCAANRLNRLGTLTYRGVGCHDPREFREHVGLFFRQLRGDLGRGALPYLWVPEWHKTHGLHGHFAVGRYVPRSLIAAAWGRGFINIKLLGDPAVGSGALEEARLAARYLAKYVGKAFDAARIASLHRYEVAQGFQPASVQVNGRTIDEAIEAACAAMGGRYPQRVSRSEEVAEWSPKPPSVWLSWAG
jgi:hypothetical protein